MDFSYRENAEMSFREVKEPERSSLLISFPQKTCFVQFGKLKSDRKVCGSLVFVASPAAPLENWGENRGVVENWGEGSCFQNYCSKNSQNRQNRHTEHTE